MNSAIQGMLAGFFLILVSGCAPTDRHEDIAIGKAAPDFRAQLMNKDAFRLKELKGSFVLLDFWGSWCAPCRKEHPELIDIYRQFSGQTFQEASGFEIVSVAIEIDSSAWETAVRKDQLPWDYQIMEQTQKLNKVNVPIAQTYQIKQVPSRFLINPKGTIVGINPSPEAVRTYLNTK